MPLSEKKQLTTSEQTQNENKSTDSQENRANLPEYDIYRTNMILFLACQRYQFIQASVVKFQCHFRKCERYQK